MKTITGSQISLNDKQRAIRSLRLAAAVVAGMAVMTSAQAQTDSAEERRASSGQRLLEEITVTAQKRGYAERAQDVPLAMTAMSGDKIEAMQAVNLTDIGFATPNANLAEQTTIPGTANFSIRGMGTVGASVPSSDPSVGVVIDGVSLGTIFGVVTDIFDLESLTVLRGPQGTLFGRNVTSGAIVMETKRPGDEFEGRVRATLGNFDRRDLALSVSGPLSDNWGGKLAVLSKDHEGMYKNRTLGGMVGAADSLHVRPTLTYQNNNFDMALIAEAGKASNDGMQTANNIDRFGNPVDPYGDHETHINTVTPSSSENYALTLDANWDEIAGGRVTTIAGWRKINADFQADIEGPLTAFNFGPGSGFDQDQASLEVRWAGQLGNRVQLTSGLYYFDQEYTYREHRFWQGGTSPSRKGVSTIGHDTAALFAEADIDLTDSLTLTVGGRYSTESKDAAIGVIAPPAVTGATGGCALNGASFDGCTTNFTDTQRWNNFSPKVGLTWGINEDTIAYTSYSRGFRSGGYNVRFTDTSLLTANPTSSPGPYDEEVVDALELGYKTTVLDGRARLNTAVFYNEYDDLQRTALVGTAQTTTNAATATAYGFEVEGTFLLTDNLVLEASVGYFKGEYDEFEFVENLTGKDASSLKFVMAPERTTALALTYDSSLGDLGDLVWRISYSHRDEAWSDDINTLVTKGYDLWDASVEYVNPTGRFSTKLFGRNLKDEVYFDFTSNTLNVISARLTPPRTYGLEVTYNF